MDMELELELLDAGWKLSVRNRKVAGDNKKYFIISALHTGWNRKTARDIIAKYHPQCHFTSGSYISQVFTYAEY